jgi:hypothetical protein
MQILSDKANAEERAKMIAEHRVQELERELRISKK